MVSVRQSRFALCAELFCGLVLAFKCSWLEMLSVLDLKYIPWHPALLLRLASTFSQQIF